MFKTRLKTKYEVISQVHHLDLLARKYIQKFFSTSHLPAPFFKLVNHTAKHWLGRTTYNPAKPATTTIEIQKAILDDENTLERVLIHELIHHADFVLNADARVRRSNTGHNSFFKEWMHRINSIMGQDFVTIKSDMSYVVPDTKEFFMLIWEYAPGQFGWAQAVRPSTKQLALIKNYQKEKKAKLVKSKESKYLSGPPVGKGVAVPRDKEIKEQLKDLYKAA